MKVYYYAISTAFLEPYEKGKTEKRVPLQAVTLLSSLWIYRVVLLLCFRFACLRVFAPISKSSMHSKPRFRLYPICER